MDHEADCGESMCIEDKSFWIAALAFHRPSKLSDEEMRFHFRRYDGKWSEQTQSAMSRFGARGLDLNDNWALTEQFWYCAGCGRSKNDCFRLSKRGILLAKLELHHDHMRDRLWPRADELLGLDWRERIPGASEVMDIIRDLVSRFSVALICSECNAAEGKAKKAIPDAHPRFTFTAQEIRQFVMARPGQEHEIDGAQASEIWQAQSNAFRMRLVLLDNLISEMGTGRLSHSKEGWPGRIPMSIRMDGSDVISDVFYDLVGWEDERRYLLSGLRDEFLARSVSVDSRRLASRVSKRASARPSDEEYAAYVDPVSTATWKATNEAWNCPCCGRGKRDIVRKGKKGRWSGGVRYVTVVIDETDPVTISRRRRLFPSFSNEAWIGDSYSVQVCSDCQAVQQSARQRDRSAPEGYLSLDAIRESIQKVTLNAPHEIDHETVTRHLRANLPYRSAYEAYTAFRSLVSRMKGIMDYRREQGIPREAVLTELQEGLLERGIESEEERAELVDWLLSAKMRNTRDE